MSLSGTLAQMAWTISQRKLDAWWDAGVEGVHFDWSQDWEKMIGIQD